ncbi:hypothetical protein [Nonomuraea sp. NPDC050310]|uniref:hypothetical protein n=1 Tax=Nonomuraea sp. NPDC050310 TaxID=3154935 RepID=UPI0033EBF3F9
MLTSKAWLRRFARKSSALGIASVLGLFAGSTFALPAQASSAALVKEATFTYSCAAGLLQAQTTIEVKISTPDTVSGTATVTWSLPALTLAQAPAAGSNAHLKVSGKLAATQGGTPADLAYTGTAAITTTAVAATTMTSTVTVSGTSGSNLILKPHTDPLILSLSTTGAPTSNCTTTDTDTLTVPIGTGGGTGGAENEVWYKCTGVNTGDEDVELNVTLTMPTSAKANEETSIGWSATNATTDGGQLKAPTGMTGAQKVFVELSVVGAGLSTGTGEGSITAVTAGSPITLPSVSVKVKPTTTGTVTVKPGPLKIGTSATAATINCALDTAQTNLKSYTFTVAAGTGGGSTTTPTPTPTTPRPTTTKTVVVTETPKTPIGKVTKTPKAGAETGGGGEMGPDGRNFVMAGTAMILAAGVGGLMMRRRRSVRG